MKRKIITLVLTLILVTQGSGILSAEEAFPPAKRYFKNFAYWTSLSKVCDNAWVDVKDAINKSGLSKEEQEKINQTVLNKNVERITSGIELGKAASKYYSSRRGKKFLELHEKYGLQMKASDVGKMQALITLYRNIGLKLHSCSHETIEDMIINSSGTIMSGMSLTSNISKEHSSRYTELAAGVITGIYGLIKTVPDLAETREAYAKLSEELLILVEEFYYPSSSSCDLMLLRDDKKRVWVQYDADMKSPYGEIVDKALIEEVKFEVDEKKSTELLDEVRRAEQNYVDATIKCVEAVQAQVEGELKEKIEQCLSKLKTRKK